MLALYGEALRGEIGRIGPNGLDRGGPTFGMGAAAQALLYVMEDPWYPSCWRGIRAVWFAGPATFRERRIERVFRWHLQKRLNEKPLWIVPRRVSPLPDAEEIATQTSAAVDAKIRGAIRTW